MTQEAVSLAVEREFWEENRKELAKEYPDKWVLIKGTDVVGSFDLPEELMEMSKAQEAVGISLARCASTEEPMAFLPSTHVVTCIDR